MQLKKIPNMTNKDFYAPSGALAPLLTVAEVAKILNVSSRTVRHMLASGELKHVRIRHAVRIAPKAVMALIKVGQRTGK